MKTYKIARIQQSGSIWPAVHFYEELTKKFRWSKHFKTHYIKITLEEIDDAGKTLGTYYVNAGNSNPYLLIFFDKYLDNLEELSGMLLRADLIKARNSQAHTFYTQGAGLYDSKDQVKFNDEDTKTELFFKGPFEMKIYLGSRDEYTQTLKIKQHNKTMKEHKVFPKKNEIFTALTEDRELISFRCNRNSGDSFYIDYEWMPQMLEKYIVKEFGQDYAKFVNCVAMFRGTRVYETDIDEIMGTKVQLNTTELIPQTTESK